MKTSHARCAAAALALAALSASQLVGCAAGKGKYTGEFHKQATERMERVKAGTSWDMARQQFLAGDLDKALKTVDQSLAHASDVPKSHVLRARILIEQGRLEEAMTSINLALEIDQAFTSAHYYKGIVYERWTKHSEAFTHYSHAAELEPTDPQYAVAAAEMLIAMEELDQAEALLTELAVNFEHNAGVRQTIGHIALMRGDLDTAVRNFQQACLLAPDEDALMEDLARAQIAKGDFADAEHSLKRLLRRSEESGETRRDLKHLRARCLVEIGRPLDARLIFDDLTTDDDGDVDFQAWLGLGQTAMILDDSFRLQRAASQLVAIAPHRHQGHTLRAVSQREAGHLRAAARTLDTAIKLAGNDPEPALLQAMVYEELGETQLALRSARIAADVSPTSGRARALIARLSTNATPTRIADVPVNPDN